MTDSRAAPDGSARASERRWLGPCLALALVPLGQLVFFLVRYTTDVPLWDSWPFALLLDRFYSGKLTFGDLWMAHNEHRPFCSRVVLLGLAWLTHWQIGAEQAVNVVVATVGLAAVFLTARAALPEGSRRRAPLLLPILGLCVYSLDQSYNWVCGWQLQFFLNLAALEVGLAILARPGISWARLAVAVACGFVATFTLASGLVYWLLGGGVLFFQSRPLDGKAKGALLAWSAATLVVAFLYVHHFADAPPEARVVQIHPDRFFALEHPLDFARFVLKALGAPIVSHHRNGAMIAGALGLLTLGAAVATLVRRGVALRPFLGILAIGAYGLLNALALAVGRAGFGQGNAMFPRYVTLTTPFWLLVVVLLAAVIEAPRSASKPAKDWAPATLAALVVAAAINAGLSFVKARADYFEHMIPGREGVVTANWELFRTHYVDVDGLAQTDQDRIDTLDQIAVLQRHKLGPFYHDRGF